LSTALATGLTDGLYYQHSDKTILLQPDLYWGSPLAADMGAAELAYRYEQCRTGIINVDVRKEGGFKKRFYPTQYGYILYDNNKFYDYSGHFVSLISKKPTWERVNGSIYEIDGFLKPLEDIVTNSVYTIIGNNADCSLFKSACIKAGLDTELNLTGGFFTYTVFAPTNAAINAAGINVNTMSSTDLALFVKRYIIVNRSIFTDGEISGNIKNQNDENLTISGSWENFSVKSASGNPITPISANIQGCNGVLHKINKVF